MASKKEITAEIASLTTIQTLTRAYAKIASERMKATRQGVLSSRDFLRAIAEVFEDVKYSYERQVKAKAGKRRTGKGERITYLAHNGKTVAVLLSANTGLYGEIVPKTFDKFIEQVKTQQVEATIVGKLGLSMFLGSGLKLPYTFFELDDKGMDRQQLAAVIGHLVQYERVLVFHGKYKSFVRQEPEMLDISGQTADDQSGSGEYTRKKYYFEPSLEEILIYFESEMFASLFEQAVREGQLAKFASRMLSMDKADQNISEKLKKIVIVKLRMKHAEDNRKQLNYLSGMRLW